LLNELKTTKNASIHGHSEGIQGSIFAGIEL
jgi:hypothetical protein